MPCIKTFFNKMKNYCKKNRKCDFFSNFFLKFYCLLLHFRRQLLSPMPKSITFYAIISTSITPRKKNNTKLRKKDLFCSFSVSMVEKFCATCPLTGYPCSQTASSENVFN